MTSGWAAERIPSADLALKANINPKIISQQLGHASVGFTLSVYSHAKPGIDRDAATTMARLVLGDDMGATPDTTDAATNLAAEDP